MKGFAAPRIEQLRVQNYRALHDLRLNDLQPLNAFLGPNGAGKSTLFDVFAFLAECFSIGLRKAWDKRGRFRELRTRGQSGPIIIEIKYREHADQRPITYHLAIDENPDVARGPYVAEEFVMWRKGRHGRPFRFLDFRNGEGKVISGDDPEAEGQRIEERLTAPDLLAVNTLGQLSQHPRIAALRSFITGWYLSYLSADHARSQPEAGPQERLSQTGDNLANVIQYLKEQHPDRLEEIFRVLRRRIPRLEEVRSELTADGRLLLRLKDAPFDDPILARYASDGTLKLLAYLIVLYDPDPPPLVGIEEPENYLHPSLLEPLAEECRKVAGRRQLFVSTHSPYFIDGLRPAEVWALYRDDNGHTRARRAADMPLVTDMMNAGAKLGDLWMENYFDAGYPQP